MLHEFVSADHVNRDQRLGHGARLRASPYHDHLLGDRLDLKDYGDLAGPFLHDDFLGLEARSDDDDRVRPRAEIAQRGCSVVVCGHLLGPNRDHGGGNLSTRRVQH